MATFKEYREEINRIFARYTKRGFVSYYDCRGLGNDMIDLMIRATKEFGVRREYSALFDLANKGFLKWAKTDKDDSDGETQDFAYYVKEAWDVVYEANDPDLMPHARMYEWFEKNLDGSVIDYMEDYLYEYVTHHFTEPELLEKKQAFFNAKIAEAMLQEHIGDYHYEFLVPRCQRNLLFVMADMKKPIEEIRAYAKDIRYYSLKEDMAQIEFAYGNLDEVIAIYNELAAQEDKQGWARENWHMKLMQIYKEQGDEKQYRKELYSAMMLNLGNEELWKIYKSGFTKEEWPEVCKKFFSEIKYGSHGMFPWYAAEERYDLIMEVLEISFSPVQLQHYEKKLKAMYPERCLALLVQATDEMAKRSSKRSDYRHVAKNLRWICKYPGGKEKAAELAAAFRIEYKQRRAMMEEIEEF